MWIFVNMSPYFSSYLTFTFTWWTVLPYILVIWKPVFIFPVTNSYILIFSNDVCSEIFNLFSLEPYWLMWIFLKNLLKNFLPIPADISALPFRILCYCKHHVAFQQSLWKFFWNWKPASRLNIFELHLTIYTLDCYC